MAYQLPPLPYDFNALEPHIDAKTMEVHYAKHHQAYCDKTNAALAGTGFEDRPIEEVLKNLDQLPEDKRTAVRNQGGGYANHNLFWTLLSPAKTEPQGEFRAALEETFGSVQDFKVQFSDKAVAQFGSGWAWLVFDQSAEASAKAGLSIISLPNQDTPVSQGKTPILMIDVWEHAYYLKYQNRRPEYVAAWWNVANWDEAARRFEEARG